VAESTRATKNGTSGKSRDASHTPTATQCSLDLGTFNPPPRSRATRRCICAVRERASAGSEPAAAAATVLEPSSNEVPLLELAATGAELAARLWALAAAECALVAGPAAAAAAYCALSGSVGLMNPYCSSNARFFLRSRCDGVRVGAMLTGAAAAAADGLAAAATCCLALVEVNAAHCSRD